MKDFPTTPFVDATVWTGSDSSMDLSWKYEQMTP